MTHLLFKVKTVLILLAISSALSANQEPCSALAPAMACCFSQPTVEIKAGYFFFSDSKMRQVYRNGGLDVQACGSYPFWSLTNRWTLNAYGAVEYFYLTGKSLNGEQKTSIWSVPVNIGLKPVYAINTNLQYYFAIGPRYFYINQHNDSSFVYKNNSKNGLGFFVNTGFQYLLCNRFVIDVFGEYSDAKIRFPGGESGIYTTNAQVGGFTFGGGLGYKF